MADSWTIQDEIKAWLDVPELMGSSRTDRKISASSWGAVKWKEWFTNNPECKEWTPLVWDLWFSLGEIDSWTSKQWKHYWVGLRRDNNMYIPAIMDVLTTMPPISSIAPTNEVSPSSQTILDGWSHDPYVVGHPPAHTTPSFTYPIPPCALNSAR
ncbi:MAG: hypothetical protein LWX54_03075 [Deltaproteobacteria bacterium]|jgi:hypothetical protein|nr:hypothetical protein [Deltaproteobacteria bacterium]